MLRFVSSLLVMLMGVAGVSPRTARPRPGTRLRRRQPEDADAAADRALEITERPRARARQTRLTWPGVVELTFDTHTVEVPGTWALEGSPQAPASGDAVSIPDMQRDAPAWAARMRAILSLQERGSSLRVHASEGGTWQTLEVRVPTSPATTIAVDRAAFATLTGARSVSLRVCGQGRDREVER